MKKKSIFVVALAALMLIAFTACEQQISTYKVPVGLTLTTTKTEYFTDEALDPSTFSGVVEYSDGSTQTLSGTELSLVEGRTSATGKTTISASYGAGSYVAKADVEVTRYAIDSIKLSNFPTTATENKDGYAVVSTDGVTVTASYNGGKTRVLDADDYTIFVTFEVAKASADEDGLYAISASAITLKPFAAENAFTNISLDGTWKVDVDPYTEEFVAEDVNYYDVEYTVTRNDEVVEDPEMDNLYIGDEVEWTIYAYTDYDDSSIVTYTAKQEVEDYYVKNNVSTKSSYTITADTDESFTVIIANPNTGAENTSIDVAIGNGTNANYITGVKSITIKDALKAESPISFEDLTIVFDWADSENPGEYAAVKANVVIIDDVVQAKRADYRFLVTFPTNDGNTTELYTVKNFEPAE